MFVTIPARSAIPHRDAAPAPAGHPFWHVSMMRPTIPRLPITAHRLCFVFRTPPPIRAPQLLAAGSPDPCVCHLLRCAPPVIPAWQSPYRCRADVALPVSRAARLVLGERPYTNATSSVRPPVARAPSLPISQQRTGSIPARSGPCQAPPERAACVRSGATRFTRRRKASVPALPVPVKTPLSGAPAQVPRHFLSSGPEVYPPSPHPVKDKKENT